MRGLFAKIADFIRESDKILLVLCTFAGLYGCAAVFSATHYKETYRAFIIQLLCTVVGVLAALIISTRDFRMLLKYWWAAAAVGIIPVILTFFIGFAPEGTDDKAWLDLGFTTFQPSELMKICFVITFSAHLSKIKKNINKPKYLIPLCLHGALPVLLIHIQGDDGTAVVFAVMMLCMMWAAGVSWKYFVALLPIAAIMAPIVYFFVMNDDQRERLESMSGVFEIIFNPAAAAGRDPNEQWPTYQQWRGRTALANGGFVGQGFLNGDFTQNGIVPYGFNDFIFVSIGEELGFLGCMAVVLLLGAICLRCLRIARLSNDEGGKYICVGIFAMIFTQTVVNIGMCLSILPVVGITLPFFSAGGTSLLCLFLGIGLALNVYLHRNSRTIYLHDSMK